MATAKNFKLKKKESPQANGLTEGIFASDNQSLSKAITLLESQKPQDQFVSNEIINRCSQTAGQSLRIGITGIPGVGKSTFIEAFGKEMVSEGHKVAVLAVDPSSQQTKGSILGDKTRMEELSRIPNVFIRPSPSGNALGGVTRATRESIILCEAAGYDIILVETVGVGQSETEVHSMVDLFLLLTLPGAGDELQGIKRGIMEMADIIAINKAEGSNKSKALLAQKQIKSAIHYFPPKANGWVVQTATISALKEIGIKELLETCKEFQKFTTKNGSLLKRRQEQNIKWFEQSLGRQLRAFYLSKPEIKNRVNELIPKIEKNEISPFQAADEVIKLLT